MQRKILYAVFSFCMLLGACKKSSSDKTNTQLISDSVWKFDNAKVAGIDVSAFLQDCDKDNTILFAANGSGTADEGLTKCDTAKPQTVSFNWSFQNNETLLHATAPLFPGGNGDFTVITLTSTKLVVSQDIDVSGSTQNAVITLKH